MSFLRTARQPLLRPLGRATAPRVAYTPFRAAHQDYGSGESAPPGQKPHEQGKNTSEDKEHPGPPPPKTGGSGQQQGGEQSNDASGQQQSQESTTSDKSSKGTQGAQPKILSDSPPDGGEQPQEVKEHNKEMDRRAEKATEKVKDEDVEKDKVGKGFWAGHGGADRQP